MPPLRAGFMLLPLALLALLAPTTALAEPQPNQWHTDCSFERLTPSASIHQQHAARHSTARGLAAADERFDSSKSPTGTHDRTVRPDPELQPTRTSLLHSDAVPAEHADLKPRRYQRRHSVLVNMRSSRNASHHLPKPPVEEHSQLGDGCPRNDHTAGQAETADTQGGCMTAHIGKTASYTHSALRKLQQLLLAAGGLSARDPSEQPTTGSAVPNMYDKQQMSGVAAGQGSLLLGAGGAPGMAASLSQSHPEYNNLLASEGSPLIQGYPQGDGTAGAQGGLSKTGTGQGGGARPAAGAGAGRPAQAPGVAGGTQTGVQSQQQQQRQQQQQQVASFSDQLYNLIMSNPLTASLLDPATAAYMGTSPPAAVAGPTAATTTGPAPTGGAPTGGAAGGLGSQQGASGVLGLEQLEGGWLQAWDQAWQGAAAPPGDRAAGTGADGGAPQPAGVAGGLGAAAGQSFQLGPSSTTGSAPITNSSAPLQGGGEGTARGSGVVQVGGIAAGDALLPSAAKPPGVGLIVEPKEDSKVSSGDVLLALGALYSNSHQQLQQGGGVGLDGVEASGASGDGSVGAGDAAVAQAGSAGADHGDEYDSDMYGSTEVGGSGAAGSEAQSAVWRQAVQQLREAGGGLAAGAGSGGQGSGGESDSGSVGPTFAPAGGVASGLRQRLGAALASALSSGGGGGSDKAGPAGTAAGRQGTAATGARGAVRSGLGGSSSGRSGVGGVGGGGAGNGNGTGPGLFPSCLPPFLLCADRDLVTLLGVTTDQVRCGEAREGRRRGLKPGPHTGIRYGVAGCRPCIVPVTTKPHLHMGSSDGGGPG